MQVLYRPLYLHDCFITINLKDLPSSDFPISQSKIDDLLELGTLRNDVIKQSNMVRETRSAEDRVR